MRIAAWVVFSSCTLAACTPAPDGSGGGGGGTSCNVAADCDDDNPCTADGCDAASSCTHEPLDIGTVCGAPADACGRGSTCDATGACVAGAFAPLGAPCGDVEQSECSRPDACDGAGQCVPNHLTRGTTCADATPDDCEAAGCDGAGACDQSFEVEPGAHTCRPAATPCDVAEACDGVTGDCPPDARSTAECRASTGECDPAELCDGVSDECPPDEVSPAGTACSDPDRDDCAVAQCDGLGACQPDFGVESAAHLCRAAAGPCDVAESCDGVGRACPADAKSTAACRPSTGECDRAESCDGAANDCPPDGALSAGTPCTDLDPNDCASAQCDGDGACDPVHALAPATIVCRPAAGACDLAESCNGLTAGCPADAKSTATCRPSTGECDPAEQCDGSAPSCPADRFVAEDTPCTDANPDDCGRAQCNALGACVQNAGLWDDSLLCRPSAGPCDYEERCNGTSVACPPDAKSTTVCRGSMSECDAAEVCDGVTDVCPDDVLSAAGTPCSDQSEGDCVAAQCDGFGFCDPTYALESALYICRPSAGPCDADDTCDGVSQGCPADAKSSAECRPAAGECDLAESCNGATDDCPPDSVSPAATPCADVDPTDCAAAQCDGFGACDQAHAAAPASVLCRPAGGPCDVAESCDGSTTVCPADGKSAAECRPALGECDLPESCDGGDVCPPDTFVAAAMPCADTDPDDCGVAQCDGDGACDQGHAPEAALHLCRPAAGACDVTDRCDGSTTVCPPDAKSNAECRAATGECDVAESCDGAGDDCPDDGFATAATPCTDTDATDCGVAQCDGAGACDPHYDVEAMIYVCRDAAGPCDVADACDGSSPTCPFDDKSTAPCRASTGECDLPESCDGAANSCPADGFVAAATACTDPSPDDCGDARCDGAGACDPTFAPQGILYLCRPSQGECDLDDFCDASATTCPADAKSTAVCRPPAGDCDLADACDGVGNVCPADALAWWYSPCTDGDACTDYDYCDGGGTCLPGGPIFCDDAVPCTNDGCDAALGCVFTPDDGNCSSDPCIGAETCDPVADCQPAIWAADDGVACTADYCFGSTPVNARCDDGIPCSLDTCGPAGCAHDYATCSAAALARLGMDPAQPATSPESWSYPGPAILGASSCEDLAGADEDGDGLVNLADPSCTLLTETREGMVDTNADGVLDRAAAVLDVVDPLTGVPRFRRTWLDRGFAPSVDHLLFDAGRVALVPMVDRVRQRVEVRAVDRLTGLELWATGLGLGDLVEDVDLVLDEDGGVPRLFVPVQRATGIAAVMVVDPIDGALLGVLDPGPMVPCYASFVPDLDLLAVGAVGSQGASLVVPLACLSGTTPVAPALLYRFAIATGEIVGMTAFAARVWQPGVQIMTCTTGSACPSTLLVAAANTDGGAGASTGPWELRAFDLGAAVEPPPPWFPPAALAEAFPAVLPGGPTGNVLQAGVDLLCHRAVPSPGDDINITLAANTSAAGGQVAPAVVTSLDACTGAPSAQAPGAVAMPAGSILQADVDLSLIETTNGQMCLLVPLDSNSGIPGRQEAPALLAARAADTGLPCSGWPSPVDHTFAGATFVPALDVRLVPGSAGDTVAIPLAGPSGGLVYQIDTAGNGLPGPALPASLPGACFVVEAGMVASTDRLYALTQECPVIGDPQAAVSAIDLSPSASSPTTLWTRPLSATRTAVVEGVGLVALDHDGAGTLAQRLFAAVNRGTRAQDGSSLVSVDTTGALLWQTPDPQGTGGAQIRASFVAGLDLSMSSGMPGGTLGPLTQILGDPAGGSHTAAHDAADPDADFASRPICGDGTATGAEACDAGADNGTYGDTCTCAGDACEPIGYTLGDPADGGSWLYYDERHNQLTTGDPIDQSGIGTVAMGQLYDGVFGTDNFIDDLGYGNAYEWVGFAFPKQPVITFAFPSVRGFSRIRVGVDRRDISGVLTPSSMAVSFSDDGVTYGAPLTFTLAAGTLATVPDQRRADLELAVPGRSGAFVRIQVGNTGWAFLDEIRFDACAPACAATCTELERCGNGLTEGPELCDDGDANGGYSFCNASCTGVTGCGDGILQPEEFCDDGAENGNASGRCALDCSRRYRCQSGALYKAAANETGLFQQHPGTSDWQSFTPTFPDTNGDGVAEGGYIARIDLAAHSYVNFPWDPMPCYNLRVFDGQGTGGALLNGPVLGCFTPLPGCTGQFQQCFFDDSNRWAPTLLPYPWAEFIPGQILTFSYFPTSSTPFLAVDTADQYAGGTSGYAGGGYYDDYFRVWVAPFAYCSGETCGDGVANGPEACDDGANNGVAGFCNAQCNGPT